MTGQSYGEGADYATQTHLNGSNIEPNGVEAPQTATSAETPQTDEGPNLSMDIAPGPDGQVINTNLPVFLTRHFYDPQKYTLLQQALKKVFRAYFDSTIQLGKGKSTEAELDEQINRDMAYRALEISLSKVLQWGAQKVLGTLPDFPPEVPGDIEENAFQPDAYEVYTLNPYNYTDVTELQKWVANLQEQGRIQSGAINTHQRAAKVQDTLIATLRESVEKKDAIIEANERLIASLEKSSGLIHIPTRSGEPQLVPNSKASDTLSFELFLTGIERRSEFDLVVDALQELRDRKLKSSFKKIVNDEPDEAADEYQEYESLRNILDRLTAYVAEQGATNYLAEFLHRMPAVYAQWYTSEKQRNRAKRTEFIEAYCIGDIAEEEEQEEPEPTSEGDEA